MDERLERIEGLLYAIAEHADAAKAEREARGGGSGHNWDYLGRAFIERREKAAMRVADALDAYIARRPPCFAR